MSSPPNWPQAAPLADRDPTDAFDADVLIEAAVPDHRLGQRVRALFCAPPTPSTSQPRSPPAPTDSSPIILDFSKTITEIDITYPTDLPEP